MPKRAGGSWCIWSPEAKNREAERSNYEDRFPFSSYFGSYIGSYTTWICSEFDVKHYFQRCSISNGNLKWSTFSNGYFPNRASTGPVPTGPVGPGRLANRPSTGPVANRAANRPGWPTGPQPGRLATGPQPAWVELVTGPVEAWVELVTGPVEARSTGPPTGPVTSVLRKHCFTNGF